ncbi:MAG TPA: two-component regulator propeller domain-containing protein [Crocinitomicaceae bacterium]|nr:two-component regulator propeller domain-containing protein [Crocinitomicaceae bacterium]
MPSNEVYSVTQDPKGFIWFGSDAGLFKFDGVRYISYKCVSQKSKAVAGLTISASGKLYCHNFQAQIFYLENDTLKELPNNFTKIPNIVCDQTGNLIVNHEHGISVYNEQTKYWKNYTDFGTKTDNPFALFTRSVRISKTNEIYFIYAQGFGKIKHADLSLFKTNFQEKKLPEPILLECYNDEQWLFSVTNNNVYRKKKDKKEIVPVNSTALSNALHNRKITDIHFLSDGNFWICTYKGVIRYNPITDVAQLLYPDFSFSDVLMDREKNYWFTTLHTGIIRVPNLDFLVWNNQNSLLNNDKIVKIENDGKHIYFASVNGTIGQLNMQTNELKTFHTGKDADIQSLVYIQSDNSVYFYSFGNLYALKNDKIQLIQANLPPVKSLLKIENDYFLASSFGMYIHSFGKTAEGNEHIKHWTRQIKYDALNQQVWIASNEGLFRFVKSADKWNVSKAIFPNQQILAIDFDATSKQLYAVSYDGKIYAVSPNGNTQLITQLPSNIQAYKLLFYQGKLYAATNKGLWIFDLTKNEWQSMNVLSGLASNNVQDLTITNNHIWLASGNGLQKIPLDAIIQNARAKVYLKNNHQQSRYLQLEHDKTLVLIPEASII